MFILTYTLLSFILIVNLIVGQLTSAYKKYVKKRNVLMLLETLSVREASEADEKYSAAISPPYPVSILNLILGTYILSVKSKGHNEVILHFYYLPVMFSVLLLFVAYQAVMLPLCYIKVVGHKFALMVKNPQGTGAKSTSDRFAYAVFFIFCGPFILLFDGIVDTFWFLFHLYKTDLDIVAKQKKENKGFGITSSINRRTFKKMLHYFELQTSSEMQQIALQKDVAMDIRDYLNVEAGIHAMIYGTVDQAQDVNKSLFYAYERRDGRLSARSATQHDQSVNLTQQNLVHHEEEPARIETAGRPGSSAADVVNEYNIVKQMLINNSLPISEGRFDTQNTSIFSRKLIIDKKILYSLLLDLQRFRKLLNLKKSFYIFHRRYDGKPPEMAKWHEKVEVRVTQTFRQLNIRRLIDVIGYDPSQYFKGEMSYMNMENIRRGRVPEARQGRRKPTDSIPASPSPLRGAIAQAPGFMNQPDVLPSKLRKIEAQYKHDNLSQNMNQLVSKYEMSSRQLKDLVDILRKLNGDSQAHSDELAFMRAQKEYEVNDINRGGSVSALSSQSLAKLKRQSKSLQKQLGNQFMMESAQITEEEDGCDVDDTVESGRGEKWSPDQVASTGPDKQRMEKCHSVFSNARKP